MLYMSIESFEVSRVVTVTGSLQPIFILVLSGIVFGSGTIKSVNLMAFLLILIASFIISFDKNIRVAKNLLKLSLISSLFTALSYIFNKMAFLNQPFLQVVIWVAICNFLIVLTFLLDSRFRKEVFKRKSAIINRKTLPLFIFTQTTGGLAGIMQNFAIFLAPTYNLATINALRGIQYVFLFFITLFFSTTFPNILKEGVSKKIIFQKLVAIVLIIFGLTLLV